MSLVGVYQNGCTCHHGHANNTAIARNSSFLVTVNGVPNTGGIG